MNIPISVIIVSMLAFTGCTSKTPPQNLNIYQGYPCGNHCDAFKKGYDEAESKQLVHESGCESIEQSLKIGCLSYIHEYRIVHSDKPVIFDNQGKQK